MRPTLFLALAMSALPVLSTAQAAEFTFTVPVDLKNLSPAIKGYLAGCAVYTAKPVGPSWKMVGSGGTPIKPIPAGKTSVQAIYTLAFDHQPSLANSANAAKWYQCHVSLCSELNNFDSCEMAQIAGAPGLGQSPVWAVAAEGSASVVVVEGPLP